MTLPHCFHLVIILPALPSPGHSILKHILPPYHVLSLKKKHLNFFLKIFFNWPYHVVCEILVLRPGIKPTDSTVEAWHLNQWTTREVAVLSFFI